MTALVNPLKLIATFYRPAESLDLNISTDLSLISFFKYSWFMAM